MASNTIKGLTVEIGGDTTKLGKALEDVNKRSRNLSSELGEINKLLKMDPGNADLLAQKQKVLAEAVANTKEKLETLKEAERQVQQQFERGEASEEQVRALQREIIAATKKLDGYEKAAQETADAIEELGDSSDEAEDGVAGFGRESEDAADGVEELADSADRASDSTEGLGDALDSIANTGLATLGGLVTAAAGALTAAAESTREYRTEMGKLDTAFTDSGFSSEAATGAYKELVGVLGETDQSVEAANHLAKLTDNEKDLAAWTGDILPGVFATFGDSLPIEGLTEAANETAKVGQVTGPLADALNWAGVSEDEFNEKLAECTDEQERQALITSTLTDLYGDASAAYKETNADVIAANKANDDWTASLAQVGAAVEPVLTSVKETGAEILGKLVPAIQTLLDNLPVVGVAIAGIAAALVSYKVAAIAATAAENGMTLAQYAAAAAQKVLNAAMLANPIGLIILAITALVAAFMYLWKNNEEFREFWINLWEKIKSVASSAVEWLKELPSKIYEAIKDAIERVRAWGEKLVTNVKTAATNMLNHAVSILKNLPSNIWNAIVGAVSKVTTWGSNLVSSAKTAATNMLTQAVSTLKNLPGQIWGAIVGAVSNVATWGSNLAAKGREAATSLFNAVVNGIKTLPSKLLSIGGDLVSGLWNGISNKVAWLKSKISGFASSILSSIKGFFGVHSPARSRGALKTTDWIGEMLDSGLANGLIDGADDPINSMRKVTGDVLGAAESVDGLSLERQLQTSGRVIAARAGGGDAITGKLDKILSAIERGQVLMLDGDALVGATAEKYDNRLGRHRMLAVRGAV